ncbi:MAG TPA: SH3 domain-containing protein [Thermoanaerobaculia bacterium]|nr:SH3 domain-containing protein [Thermoanaerobaculia bacterium]
MRRLLPVLLLIACSTSPAPPPAPAPVATAPAADEPVTGTVRVTASVLNVRAEAAMDAVIVTQVKYRETLSVLREQDGWMRVRLASGETGWVATRYVTRGNLAPRPRGGCPPDSDYAFLDAPPLGFSERGAHGLVVVEANVNAKGIVTSTKVISNNTGDPSLGPLTEKEIRAAKFSPPIENCAPRAFIFTYRRTF